MRRQVSPIVVTKRRACCLTPALGFTNCSSGECESFDVLTVRNSSATSGIIAAAVELQSFRLVTGHTEPTTRCATMYSIWYVVWLHCVPRQSLMPKAMCYGTIRATPAAAHAWLAKHNALSCEMHATVSCACARWDKVGLNGLRSGYNVTTEL